MKFYKFYILLWGLSLLGLLVTCAVFSILYANNHLVWDSTICQIIQCNYNTSKCNYTVNYLHITSSFTMDSGDVCLRGNISCWYNRNNIYQVCFLKSSNNWITGVVDWDLKRITVIAVTGTLFGCILCFGVIFMTGFERNEYEELK